MPYKLFDYFVSNTVS